jgi:hypothetical protein
MFSSQILVHYSLDLSKVYDFKFHIFLSPNFWKDTFGLNYMSKDVLFDFHKKNHIRRIWEQFTRIRFLPTTYAWACLSKNLYNKENLSLNCNYYTLKLSLFSICLSKFWFHSILHLTIWQQGYNNDIDFFSSTNKQLITRRKRPICDRHIYNYLWLFDFLQLNFWPLRLVSQHPNINWVTSD